FTTLFRSAAVPRHGTHRLSAERRVLSRPAGFDSARELPRAAGALASGSFAPPRNRIGGAQLRIFPVRPPDQRRRAGRSRSVLLANRAQWRRAGLDEGDAKLRAEISGLGLQSARPHSRVRPRRSGTGGALLPPPPAGPGPERRPRGARA